MSIWEFPEGDHTIAPEKLPLSSGTSHMKGLRAALDVL